MGKKKKKKNQLRILTSNELQQRAQFCKDEKLCFITKEPINNDTSFFLKHSEVGMVLVNPGIGVKQ